LGTGAGSERLRTIHDLQALARGRCRDLVTERHRRSANALGVLGISVHRRRRSAADATISPARKPVLTFCHCRNQPRAFWRRSERLDRLPSCAQAMLFHSAFAASSSRSF
jgi:hypothetical protein